MILYDLMKGLTRQECLVSLGETFGNEAPPEKIVYNWFTEFSLGRSSVSRTIKINSNFKQHRCCAQDGRSACYVSRNRNIPWHITGCNAFDFTRTFSCQKDLFQMDST